MQLSPITIIVRDFTNRVNAPHGKQKAHPYAGCAASPNDIQQSL